LLYQAICAVSISTRCHVSNGREVLLNGSLGLTGCLQMGGCSCLIFWQA
jgi:hypothetical protein